MKRVFAWLTVCLLAGCGGEKRGVTSDTLYVPRIAGMTEAFILGMDASTVPSLKAGGVRYYDFDGREKDDFEILSENGISYIRVRLCQTLSPYRTGTGRCRGGCCPYNGGGHDKRHRCSTGRAHGSAPEAAAGRKTAGNGSSTVPAGPAPTPPPTTRRTRANTTAAAPWTIRRFLTARGARWNP